jgi:uncharacterized membrane protein (UPF0127 family)
VVSRPSRSARRLEALPRIAVGDGLELRVARSLRARARGLAGLDELPPGVALLLPRCRAVHTFGMRFALDVVFLDGGGLVLHVAARVPPRRHAAVRAAHAVVETRAGESARFLAAGLEAGAGGASAPPLAQLPMGPELRKRMKARYTTSPITAPMRAPVPAASSRPPSAPAPMAAPMPAPSTTADITLIPARVVRVTSRSRS